MSPPLGPDQEPRRRKDSEKVSVRANGLAGKSPRGLRRRLQGRWRWVWLSGLVFAAAGGYLGWDYGLTTYRAEGRVQYTVALPSDALNSAVVNLQRDSAAASDEPGGWDQALLDATLDREIQLLEKLGGQDKRYIQAQRVEDSRTQLDVFATANSKETAADALRAALAAYEAQTPMHEEVQAASQYNQERRKLQTLSAQLTAKRDHLRRVRFGLSDSVENADHATTPDAEQGGLDVQWAAAWSGHKSAEAQAKAARERYEKIKAMPVPSRGELAAVDEKAADWDRKLRRVSGSLREPMVWLNGQWRPHLIEQQDLQGRLTKLSEANRVVMLGDEGLAFRAVNLKQEQEIADRLDHQAARATATLDALRPWREQTLALEREVAESQKTVASQEQVLASLAVPSAPLRLVETAIDLPASELPSGVAIWKDTRPTLAAAGAGAGFAVGVMLSVLILASDKRVRASSRDDALIGSGVPLIGMVPVIDESTADAEGKEDTAAPIHGVRAVLEAKMDRGENSFAISGVGRGSGVTSIAVGAAASMALAGSKVLLVDLAWLREPGQGVGDEESARIGLGVDGVLSSLGYLDEEDREELQRGSGETTGFGALLSGKTLGHGVVQTRVAGLEVLSAMGASERLRAAFRGRVSSRWLRKLYDVSKHAGYDSVIVDAGSARGSVEGILACGVADCVVLVVSNDEAQKQYDQAMARLNLIDARLIGVVLNRAGARRRPASGRTGIAKYQGGSVGSGIFAAAVESRAGGQRASTPLPSIESLSRPEDPPALDDDDQEVISAFGEPSSAATNPEPVTHGINEPGVDPFGEPAAQARPTPARIPPVDLDHPGPQKKEHQPATQAQPDAAEPEVFVMDDVMDQLVNNAIRTAHRDRSAKQTHAADRQED